MGDIYKGQIIKLQDLCKHNLKFLCQTVLGMSYWYDPIHNDLTRELYSPGHKKLILMPRGHLKSTVVTVGYTIQRLLQNPNLRVLITNAVWERARDFLREIAGLLTAKTILPDLFGAFDGPGSRFTQDNITIAQRTKAVIKEPTISTAGVETALTGGHYDLIIHDDLVEENNVATKEQIQKIIRFYQNSLDLLDPGCDMIVIGTRWAMGDLYGHIIENEMVSLNGKPVQPSERNDWRQLMKARK